MQLLPQILQQTMRGLSENRQFLLNFEPAEHEVPEILAVRLTTPRHCTMKTYRPKHELLSVYEDRL
jgi:hypothetical protein